MVEKKGQSELHILQNRGISIQNKISSFIFSFMTFSKLDSFFNCALLILKNTLRLITLAAALVFNVQVYGRYRMYVDVWIWDTD
jgi:hypothetical protein